MKELYRKPNENPGEIEQRMRKVIESKMIDLAQTGDYTCDNCGSDKRWQCRECGKRFFAWDAIYKHIARAHVNVKPWKCDNAECPHTKEFGSWIIRYKHKQGFHSTRYQCKICRKPFQNNSALKRHFRVHTGEKPFHCHDCGRDFNQKSNLKTHIRNVHECQQQYICSKCGQGFGTNVNFQGHNCE